MVVLMQLFAAALVVRGNAHKRVQALPTIPRHGVNTVDALLQERVKSRKN